MAHIFNVYLTPDSPDGYDLEHLVQTHISSRSLPNLLSSARNNEGQPSPSSVKTIRTRSESISSRDTTVTGAILEQRDEGCNDHCNDNYSDVQPLNHDGQLHDSRMLSYIIKKIDEVTERSLEDWSVRKTIILATILIVLYQLSTLIHAVQVDRTIV